MRRSIALALFLVTAVSLLTMVSCSGGGGGGGGGPTIPPPVVKELDSPVIPSAGTFTHRFFTAGTFPYSCTLHAVMTGVNVVVSNSAPAGDTVGAVSIVGTTAPFYSPTTLTIRTGGRVVWTNPDAMPHTVTSD